MEHKKTLGEVIMETEFDGNNMDPVQKIKERAAQLINLIDKLRSVNNNDKKNILIEESFRHIVVASVLAIKSIDIKDEENNINRGFKKLIYKEDNQGYSKSFIVFETDANLSVEKLSSISYEYPGAGMFSTSFDTFKTLMETHGFTVNKIEELNQQSFDNSNYLDLEIVKGATGNY